MKKIRAVSSIILLLAVGCQSTVRPEDQGHTIEVGTRKISVTLADTAELQARGLGGIPYLGDDEGMFFLFTDQRNRVFWMKGMLIPIDIIWIRKGKIMGIEKRAQPPGTNASDESLPRFRSPEPADAVLEVRSGFSDDFGLQVGDTITYR